MEVLILILVVLNIYLILKDLFEKRKKKLDKRNRSLKGLAIARKNGTRLGRPNAHQTTRLVQYYKNQGLSQSKVAAKTTFSLPTVKRHWNKSVDEEFSKVEYVNEK